MRSALERAGLSLRATATPLELVVFAWLPAIALGIVFFSELQWGNSLGNFTIFRAASLAVLHGHSPFPAAIPAVLARNDTFVYPPITGFLLAPFAVVPVEVARVLMLAAGAACVVIALRMLGVRDWRCYGLALVSAPVMGSISIGALSTLLLLGAAVVWRFRDSPSGAGATTAVTTVSKLFLWPLWVWLLATRRLRAAAVAAVAGAVLVVGGWAAIGFAGLAGYPHLLHVLSAIEASQSYSLVGLLGLTGGSALALSVALALGVIAATFATARGVGGDRRAFSVAIAGALLATPVLWLHYFALLLVPIALYRPRLSALWFAPLAFWLTPFAHSDGSAWKAAFALTAAGAIVLGAVATGSRQRRPPRWETRTPSLAMRAPE